MSKQSENVTKWTESAKTRKSRGFVDMCDTFDHTHYPVFFGGPDDDYKTSDEILQEKDGKNMQKSYGVFNV